MDEIKRLTPAQRARCNRLIRRLCANYDGGNCLPLDDGEGCVCVQTISYSLLCKYLSAGGSARRQGTLRRYLPAAHTALRPVWKALSTQQQPAEILPGMRLLHPTQAEGRLCQTAAQRRTLSAEKALISGAFLREKRVRVAVSIRARQNPLLTFYKGEISMGNKLKTVDAETLLSTPMSKTMFIVDGLISQGVNVISGASKIGKSWLMLWLGLQVAQGNSIWGLPTLQCDVLYLSLEDTQRRIKDRLYNLTDSAPDNLYFAVTSGLIGGGLEEQITDFLTEHSATKLVIIDTLQKVRDSKGSAGKAGMYGNDYDDISSIKRIADGFNIAILLVHHLRKLQDSDDPFNDVSGSTGIISAADTNFILRRKRSGNAATLLVSGRDVEYQELTLQFNDLVWELVERKNSEDIHKAELPKFLFRVVDFMECRTEWVGTATELLTEMKEQEVTPNMVTKYLGQFAYEVLEPLGIEYRTKRTGKSRLIKFLRRDGDDANDAGIAI